MSVSNKQQVEAVSVDSVFPQHQQMEDIRITLGYKTFLRQQKFHSISKFVLSILSSILTQGYFDNCSINPINGWLVGCFGLNGPLGQYFSLYRAVSQRKGERKEK